MRIPPGFHTISPYFFVQGAEPFIDFLIRGLGGVEILRHMNGSRVANAQVCFGDATVMISEASAAFPAMPCAHYLFVKDADAAVSKAVEAGGELIMEVADMPYNDRQGGVRDRWGNIWWLSQRLVDGPY